MAGRPVLGAGYYVLRRRQNIHARNHGLELGESLRKSVLVPEKPTQLNKSQEPAQSFQTILGCVVGDQGVVDAYTVASGSGWNDGLNRSFSGETFQGATGRLVAEQLESQGLSITPVEADHGRGLLTNNLLRDGSTLPASALFFDSEVLLQGWLNQPGNSKYSDRTVLLPGVLQEGEARTVWAVLVGVAQYVNHYLGIRMAPNAKLVFTPASGFNEGALMLKIATRNGAGVAKGSPLLLDYGDSFNLAAAKDAKDGAPVASVFRGALDVVFDSQKTHLPEEVAVHQEEVKAEEEERVIEIEEENKRKAEEELQAAAAKKIKRDKEALAAEKKQQELAKAKELAASVVPERLAATMLLNTLTEPPCEFRLGKCADPASLEKCLMAVSTAPSNKKIKKHTLMMKWSDNTVAISSKESDASASFSYQLEPGTWIYCKEAGAAMTLKKAFQERYQEYAQIFSYAPFTKGSLPKVLTEASKHVKEYRVDFSHKSFDSCREDIIFAIDLARSAPGLQVLWIMKGSDDKKMVKPAGLAIVTTSQILLPGMQTHEFVV